MARRLKKYYICRFVQKNGIEIIGEFKSREIRDRIEKWIKTYKSVTISKELEKEYKY